MNMRRVLSCVLLPADVASCTSWRVESVGPAPVVGQDEPSTIRVTLNDGTRFELNSPVVSGDTLLGLKTVGLVVGLAPLFVGIATTIACAPSDDFVC